MVNLYLFMLLGISLFMHGPHGDVCLVASVLPPPPGVIAFGSLMFYTCIIQMCILPMYRDLECRTPARFQTVLLFSFGALFILFGAFGALGYLLYGPAVHDNVLQNLPGTPSGNLARVAMAGVVLCVFPIMMQAITAPVEALGDVDLGPDWPCSRVNGVRVLVVGSVAIVACFVQSLGFLNVLNGCVSLFCFVGLAPAIVGLYILPTDGEVQFMPLGCRGWWWRLAMGALMLGCTIEAFVGLAYDTNYPHHLAAACLL